MKIPCRFYRFFLPAFLLIAGPFAAWAQEGPEVFYPPGMEPPARTAPAAPPATAAAPTAPAATTAPPAATTAAGEGGLPRSYRGITLGMSLADLKSALQKEPLLNFRGDRDVSFLPASAQSQNLVETTGPSFIRRAFFQLRDGELFIMAYALNTGLVDHYSVFTGLVEKYGEPSSLNPKEAVWETESTRISIERPLTVKYIDMRIFREIVGESSLAESSEVRRRQEFLDEF